MMMSRQIGICLCTGMLALAAPAAAQDVASAQGCELHVWPTQRFDGISIGFLGAFGAIGGAIDGAANAGKVKTIEGRMAEFLGPNDQIAELDRAGVRRMLTLDGYRLVAEAPLPSKEEAKNDAVAKAQREAMEAKLKSGERLSTSTAPCYAELIGTRLLYMKTAFSGPSLESDWTFRTFPPTGKASRKVSGSGKAKIADFPPKTEADLPAAKAGLRAAYAEDFTKFAQKKLAFRSAAAAR